MSKTSAVNSPPSLEESLDESLDESLKVSPEEPKMSDTVLPLVLELEDKDVLFWRSSQPPVAWPKPRSCTSEWRWLGSCPARTAMS